ncbi:MAG TPA: hypothetical protein PK479_02615 [Novosphingobium sp.]|nr:hypothetical protein [Novosphingobium sp.]
MKPWSLLLILAATPVCAATIPSSPDLGKARGRCRAGEPGPALLVSALGLKD